MTIEVLGYFLAGALFLVLGADILVRGASRLTSIFGISPLVIGLTVVFEGRTKRPLHWANMYVNHQRRLS